MHQWLKQVNLGRLVRLNWRSIGRKSIGLLLGFLITVSLSPSVAKTQPKPLVNSAAPTITAPSSLRSAAQLLNDGKVQYAGGHFFAAMQVWQQAAQAYQAQHDRLNQALSLSYCSLADQALGRWEQAQQAITTSLALLQTVPSDRPSTAILAQTLNTQGQLKLAIGQPEAALENWQTAEQTYKQINDVAGGLGSQINQAQALQTLGLFRRSQTLLTQIAQQLQAQPDSALKATGLRSLGTVWQVVGDLKQAEAALQQSLAVAQRLQLAAEMSATFTSLGNTARSQQNSDRALQFYRQATVTAPTAIGRLESQANQLSLLVEQQQFTPAQTLWQTIQPELKQLTASRSSIYTQVNLATSLIKWHHRRDVDSSRLPTVDSSRLLPTVDSSRLPTVDPSRLPTVDPSRLAADSSPPTPTSGPITDLLTNAIQQAQHIQDTRAESLALGQLGHLNEQDQHWSIAQKLTQQALLIAQTTNAADIAYRWQWQLGRIYQQQANRPAAIAAYTESVNLLKTLRSDLVAMSPDVQFSFREAVEPVYRELVELLVQSDQPSQPELQQARATIEALQLAELDNFLRSACLKARSSQVDQVDQTAAVVYPIILADRLAVILSVPGQPLTTYQTKLPKGQIAATLESTLAALNPIVADTERLRLTQQVYDWLLRPAEPALAQGQIKTLVFVLDGRLRNIPMSALHDGQHYLIEKYGIAITPGLQLLEPRSLTPTQRLQVLIGGLTEARQGFAALPSVAFESEQIAKKLTANVFLNHKFTRQNLQDIIRETAYPLVHLATHGQFSSKLDDTFILTWNERLTIEGLRQLLQLRAEAITRPIELLVLSACETAEGDQRATLGLAGLAVRSGARSTLATLWSVHDASTADLMVEFYKNLTQQNRSKAEALRQAQLALLNSRYYQHPFYWAPFILVGNWL